MKKIFNLSVAIIFALTFTVFTAAQDTLPEPTPQPTPPAEEPMPQPTPPAEEPGEDTTKTDVQDYDISFINKADLAGKQTKLSAEIEGLNAEALLEVNQDGIAQVKIAAKGLNQIDKDKVYTVWLATPEGAYTKISEFSYSEDKMEDEIKGSIPIDSFGFFITAEDGSVEKPTSKTYAAFKSEAGE